MSAARWFTTREERLFFAGLLTGGYGAGWSQGAFSLAWALAGWVFTAAVLLALDVVWPRLIEPAVTRLVRWLFDAIDGGHS